MVVATGADIPSLGYPGGPASVGRPPLVCLVTTIMMVAVLRDENAVGGPCGLTVVSVGVQGFGVSVGVQGVQGFTLARI